MKFRKTLIYAAWLFVAGCECNEENPAEKTETIAIHNPIYPEEDTPVNFSLFLVNDILPEEVIMEVRSRKLQDNNTWSDNSVVLLKNWQRPVNFPLTYNHKSGFERNTLITYSYRVKTSGQTYSHEVTFAINPYPFSITDNREAAQPAPVYVTAEVSRACNIVFIPGSDLTNVVTMPGVNWSYYFLNSVRNNIRSGILKDPATRKYIRGYNFFVNPFTHTGQVNFETGYFDQPDNRTNIEFAAKCFIHNAGYFDFALHIVRCFSSRIYNAGTFMHESGHILYYLSDEYEGGKHYYQTLAPNNWKTESDAASAASSFGLTAEHVYPIEGTSEKFFILCPYEGCQMGLSGLSSVNYCKPCIRAVDYFMPLYLSP